MGTIPGRIEPVFLNGGSAVAENIVRLFAGRANTPPLLEGVIEIAASTSTNEFPRNRGCDHGDSITVQGNTQRFQGGRGRRGLWFVRGKLPRNVLGPWIRPRRAGVGWVWPAAATDLTARLANALLGRHKCVPLAADLVPRVQRIPSPPFPLLPNFLPYRNFYFFYFNFFLEGRKGELFEILKVFFT